MPRVLPKPKFRDDDLVTAIQPFSGSIDGAPFVANPSDPPRRADDPIARAYPEHFAKQGDRERVAVYWTAVNAAQAEERAERDSAERRRRVDMHKRAMRLADQLERDARRQRERNTEATKASWADEAARKRKRVEDDEKRAQEAHVRMLAEMEVARRLAAEGQA